MGVPEGRASVWDTVPDPGPQAAHGSGPLAPLLGFGLSLIGTQSLGCSLLLGPHLLSPTPGPPGCKRQSGGSARPCQMGGLGPRGIQSGRQACKAVFFLGVAPLCDSDPGNLGALLGSGWRWAPRGPHRPWRECTGVSWLPWPPPAPLSGFLLLSLNPLQAPLPKASRSKWNSTPKHTKARINSWLCLGTDVQQLGAGGWRVTFFLPLESTQLHTVGGGGRTKRRDCHMALLRSSLS